jgi:hypothetical protein
LKWVAPRFKSIRLDPSMESKSEGKHHRGREMLAVSVSKRRLRFREKIIVPSSQCARQLPHKR